MYFFKIRTQKFYILCHYKIFIYHKKLSYNPI